MIDRFLGDVFGFFSCQFWSTVLQFGARLPIHTLNYWTVQSVVHGLTGGVFECDIVHRRSVVVLCMLYKIRCKAMHPLNGALPGPYVPAWVTRDALVTHRYTYAPPRCRTWQYNRTFIPLSVFPWNDLASPVFDGVGRGVSRAGPMLFYCPKMLYPFHNLLLFFPSLLSVYRLVLWGWGLRSDMVYITLSEPYIADLF